MKTGLQLYVIDNIILFSFTLTMALVSFKTIGMTKPQF